MLFDAHFDTATATEKMKPHHTTEANFSDANFDDFDMDSNGDPTGVSGIP